MAIRLNSRLHLSACAGFLLFLSGPAVAADAVGQAEKLRGEAHIQRAGADLPVAVGTPFELRDRVQTGAGARLKIAFRDGSTLTLAENTAIEITRYAVSSGASRNIALTLLSGMANVVAAKSGEPSFNYQVRTSGAYSAVRGTNWIVGSLAAGSSFYVLDGLVEVGTGGGSRVVVDAGQSVSVDAQGAMSTVQPIPPDLMRQVLDATDVASANAAPETAPPATTAPATAPDETPSNPAAPSPPAKSTPTREKSGGGGGGHGHM